MSYLFAAVSWHSTYQLATVWFVSVVVVVSFLCFLIAHENCFDCFDWVSAACSVCLENCDATVYDSRIDTASWLRHLSNVVAEIAMSASAATEALTPWVAGTNDDRVPTVVVVLVIACTCSASRSLLSCSRITPAFSCSLTQSQL